MRVVRRDRDARRGLLPALRAEQRGHGWVSPDAVADISQRLGIPQADVYGVASFYHLIALEPRPLEQLHVCTDVVCALKGATVPDGAQPSACLGLCDRAPAALLTVAGDEPREVQLPEADPPAKPRGDFELLRRARELGAAEVRRLVADSGLLGRGGAAFPTGAKWDAVAAQPAPRYLVCNADESEPGAFKDRTLLETEPFALVEAIAIAAFAAGCERAYLYIRGEYPLAHARLADAIAQSPLDGLEIELRHGAGAYVCGEETALFRSIEGHRGEPQSKPPFPTERGLFGRPTVVNNVETLISVLDVLRTGAAPTRRYCVSGDVERPGVYEAPLDATVAELVERAGGEPKAVLAGGASGVFLTPDELGRPLEGTGVVIVFGPDADLGAAVIRIAEFFREESCGQCVPCRVGTVRQLEALRQGDREPLADLAQVMRDASICGLGQTAATAVQSALAKGLV